MRVIGTGSVGSAWVLLVVNENRGAGLWWVVMVSENTARHKGAAGAADSETETDGCGSIGGNL